MRAGLLFCVLALSACRPTGPVSLPVLSISVELALSCDAGCALLPVEPSAPVCGYDVDPIPDAGLVTGHSAIPRAAIKGVLRVDTRWNDGGVFDSRRSVMGDVLAMAPAFPAASDSLYLLSSVGTVRQLDGGLARFPATFSYVLLTLDGGVGLLTETHRLVSTETREVLIEDHSGDPFYGCR